MAAKPGAVRKLLRLVSVLRVLLPEYRALRRHSKGSTDNAAESHRLTYDIGWSVYRQMAEPPLLIASAIARDPRKRLKLATDLFRSFPFGSPSYEWRDVAGVDGAIAFDCVKCPVAEFFASHDASELCVQTFCRPDFPLAQIWGGKLERSVAIASRAQRCDQEYLRVLVDHRHTVRIEGTQVPLRHTDAIDRP